MGYEIITEDMKYGSSKKGKTHKKNNKDKKSNLKYLHLFIVVIILLSLVYFFYSRTVSSNFYLKGEVEEFNIVLNENLTIESDNFKIYSDDINLQEQDGKIYLEDFIGSLFLENETFFLEGTASNIEIDKSSLNIKSVFKIEFVSVDLPIELSSLNFELNDGRVKHMDLDYSFSDKTKMTLNNFDGNIGYSKNEISFSGDILKFELENEDFKIIK